MSFVNIFNLFEAVWWIALGIAVGVVQSDHPILHSRRPLAAVLIVFGLSDLVELWSQAWWRPWWLGVLKVACGVTIAVVVLRSLRRDITNASGVRKPIHQLRP